MDNTYDADDIRRKMYSAVVSSRLTQSRHELHWRPESSVLHENPRDRPNYRHLWNAKLIGEQPSRKQPSLQR